MCASHGPPRPVALAVLLPAAPLTQPAVPVAAWYLPAPRAAQSQMWPWAAEPANKPVGQLEQLVEPATGWKRPADQAPHSATPVEGW